MSEEIAVPQWSVNPLDIDRALGFWLASPHTILEKRSGYTFAKFGDEPNAIKYVAWNENNQVQYFSDWSINASFAGNAAVLEQVWRRRPVLIPIRFHCTAVWKWVLTNNVIESRHIWQDDDVSYWRDLIVSAAKMKFDISAINDETELSNCFQPKTETILKWYFKTAKQVYKEDIFTRWRWRIDSGK